MAILIGSQSVSQVFFSLPGNQNPNGITGSVFTLPSSSYTGSGDWANTNTTIGGNASVVNGPLSQGSNGRWAFNGTSQYLTLTQSIIDNQFPQYDGSVVVRQPFTFVFKGTIGSLATKRALFGAAGNGNSYVAGGDALLRTDTSGPNEINLDLRGPQATTGGFNRYTLTGASGSLLDIVITQDSSGNQKVYQNNNLIGSGNPIAGGYAPFNVDETPTPAPSENTYLLYNEDTDTDNYNGELEYIYLYNRPLDEYEVKTLGNLNAAVTASFVYLGSNQIFRQNQIPTDYKLYLNAADTISYPTSGGLWYNISGSNSLTSTFTGSGWVFTGSNSFQYDSDDFFVTQSQTAFDVLSATSSFSIYTVFKSNSSSGVRQVISKNQSAANYMGWALGYNTFTGGSEGRFGLDFLGVDGGSSKRINVEFTPTIGTSSFTHVCATYNGNANASGVILYLDGVSGSKATQVNVNNFNTATNPKTNAYTFIGARDANGTPGTGLSRTNVFNGKIAAILIYDRTLSSAEVANIYSELSGSFTN